MIGRRPSWAFILLTGLVVLLYTFYLSITRLLVDADWPSMCPFYAGAGAGSIATGAVVQSQPPTIPRVAAIF